MSSFKRAVSLFTAMVFVGISFAGCALFVRDTEYYNNLVVARVGKDITVTKKQLIDGFNSFGYQYVSTYGYTMSKAYNTTLDTLISREILAKISANTFGFGESESGIVKYIDESTGALRIAVTDFEAAQARKTSYEAVESALREIEAEVRKDKKWSDSTKDDESTVAEETTFAVYTPYEKYLIKEENTFKINLEKYREPLPAEFIYESNDDFIEYLQRARGEELSVESMIAIESFNRFVRYLSNNEKGLGYKYDTIDQKKNAIKRELVRIQTQEEKNLLANRIEECFEQGLVNEAEYNIMMDLRGGLGYASFAEYEEYIGEKNYQYTEDLVRRAEASYKSSVLSAIDRYNRKLDPESGYASKLLAGLKDIYFVPRNIADQFFTVSHILIEYTDEQKSKLTKINEDYEQDKNENNRNNALNALRGEVTAVRRVDGVESGSAMSANEVLAYIENYVAPNSRMKSLDRKLTDFRDCIYMFNTDPGMENPEFEYVIGIDTRTDKSPTSTETDSMSQMVPEFTAAARKLYNYDYQELRGGVKKELVDGKYQYTDLRGTMSGLVWTEYGAHIIMYTRNIADFIYTNTADLLDSSYGKYLHATQTSYGNKTAFDVVIENLSKSSYATHEANLLGDFKGNNKTVYYRGNYKDLTKV